MTAVAATTGPDILSAEFDADPYPFYALTPRACYLGFRAAA